MTLGNALVLCPVVEVSSCFLPVPSEPVRAPVYYNGNSLPSFPLKHRGEVECERGRLCTHRQQAKDPPGVYLIVADSNCRA